MTETIVLGIVGIKNCGEYDSETTYEKLNVVTYEGSSYCALQSTKGNLPTDTDYWQLYAQKGDTGATGATGATGSPGAKGEKGDPSGAPVAVSDVSEMTDTTKVYVNTTDGKWYYYDGDNWEIGGTYQATELAENSVTKYKLDEELQNDIYSNFGLISTNLYDYTTVPDKRLTGNLDPAQAQYGKLVNSSSTYSFVLPIEPNKTLSIEKVLSERFAYFTTTNQPAVGVSYNSEEHDATKTKYTIQTGANDHYIVISYYNQNTDTKTQAEIKASIKVYYGENWIEPKTNCKVLEEEIQSELQDIEEEIQSLEVGNLSSMSPEIVRLLSFRNLGSLDKGYLCLMADDGQMTLSTKTFGILQEKNVPCTFALMSSSPIVNPSTGDITGLKNMINNHGCSVCQHGSTEYGEYTEQELITFLDNEKAFWASKNIAVDGLVYPSHYRTNLIRAICGSKYGVCCDGLSIYPNNTNGTRSNIFDLGRISVFSDTDLQASVDYAIANKKLLIVYWHDNSISSSAENEQKLRNFIDYAKSSGIEFITLDKVKTL